MTSKSVSEFKLLVERFTARKPSPRLRPPLMKKTYMYKDRWGSSLAASQYHVPLVTLKPRNKSTVAMQTSSSAILRYAVSNWKITSISSWSGAMEFLKDLTTSSAWMPSGGESKSKSPRKHPTTYLQTTLRSEAPRVKSTVAELSSSFTTMSISQRLRELRSFCEKVQQAALSTTSRYWSWAWRTWSRPSRRWMKEKPCNRCVPRTWVKLVASSTRMTAISNTWK